MIQPATAPRTPSSNGISAITGPSVIKKKQSDAGYLVVFKKESHAGMGGKPFHPCVEALHGRGSPYKLKPRSTKKRASDERPIARHNRLLRDDSKIRILPKA